MAEYVLVLNAGYEFLNVTSLHRAIKLLYKGKAEVLEIRPDREIHSPSVTIDMPSIIRLLYYIVSPFREVPLTKKNVLIRDRHNCQYCGKKGNTVDHILPRSRGGKDVWTNCVCACGHCNTGKNNRTPAEADMKLLRKPKKPMYITWFLMKWDIGLLNWNKYL
ncbi:MAG: HNH endonuclease [Candidatus Eremiobacteraeota bacterium]|nr:HNH endonuclease [Candidatus Eremiobacteraeota bacterium]